MKFHNVDWIKMMKNEPGRKFYTLNKDLRKENYDYLIDCALENGKCRFCFLIVRKAEFLNPSGQDAIQLLKPYLIDVQTVSDWPGTKLLWDTANLYKYNFCFELADLLKKISRGILDWKLPDLPEDLCFMIDENTPWMFSITHERDIVLFLSAGEIDYLAKKGNFGSMLIVDENYNQDK
jgi:hypothetical protein